MKIMKLTEATFTNLDLVEFIGLQPDIPAITFHLSSGRINQVQFDTVEEYQEVVKKIYLLSLRWMDR